MSICKRQIHILRVQKHSLHDEAYDNSCYESKKITLYGFLFFYRYDIVKQYYRSKSACVALILYNSSTNKKFILSELHYGHNIVCFFCFANKNSYKIKPERNICAFQSNNAVFHSWMNRFSFPVLAPPCSAHFVCISYHFRCLFYLNVSALRSGHHMIFCHDSSSKRVHVPFKGN